jgi:hypothetical protein
MKATINYTNIAHGSFPPPPQLPSPPQLNIIHIDDSDEDDKVDNNGGNGDGN